MRGVDKEKAMSVLEAGIFEIYKSPLRFCCGLEISVKKKMVLNINQVSQCE